MNGKLWDVGKPLIVAAVVGLITMYGTSAKLTVRFEMLHEQVRDLTATVNKHIQDYAIHVPHEGHNKSIK